MLWRGRGWREEGVRKDVEKVTVLSWRLDAWREKP